jgi:hypothetical protein
MGSKHLLEVSRAKNIVQLYVCMHHPQVGQVSESVEQLATIDSLCTYVDAHIFAYTYK